jgi:hypothetical protein
VAASAARPYKKIEGGLELAVRLTPKGGPDRIDGVVADADDRVWLAARVSPAPEGGKANKALIRLLAKQLGVAPRAVTLISGETQRLKRLRIVGDASALIARLEEVSRDRALGF